MSNNKILDNKKRRLQKLREEEALKGINTSPEVLIEIENLEAEIQKLQGATSQQDDTKPSIAPPVPPRPTPQTSAAPPPPKAQPATAEEQKKGGSKWWIPIAVALISLIGVVFVAVWNNPPSPDPSIEEMQPAEFEYQVRVQTNSGENLPDALVTIEIGGRVPLDAFTDSHGLAAFFIEGSYAGEAGFLMVEREGFNPHRQHIELVMDALPDVIRLEPMP